MHAAPYHDDEPSHASSSAAPRDLGFSTDGIHMSADRASVHSADDNAEELRGGIIEVDLEPTVRTRLLSHNNYDSTSGDDENRNNGAMSPRPASGKSYGSFTTDVGFGGRYPGAIDPQTGEAADATHALLGDAIADGVLGGRGGKSTTQYLAEQHGVRHKKLM